MRPCLMLLQVLKLASEAQSSDCGVRTTRKDCALNATDSCRRFFDISGSSLYDGKCTESRHSFSRLCFVLPQIFLIAANTFLRALKFIGKFSKLQGLAISVVDIV